MRACSPVLSAGRRRRSSGALSSSLRGFSRIKSPAVAAAVEEEEELVPQVPVLLLQDMNLCYRLLRRLVPGLPPGRAASRVEILQHVIDYILELQTELDATCPTAERPELPGGERLKDRRQRHTQRAQSEQIPGRHTPTFQTLTPRTDSLC
ncbi:DNA-binding protein inhibitor ID-2b [Halichoeres trimaculatus]|uniref:DNA-binding protein inhibitor ID-2b n=1 Tax=Halichoeres trimaculatus TaxID=147232 RepID=UPI003D9E5B50